MGKNKKKDSTFFRKVFFLFNNSNNIELKGANKDKTKPITISIKIKLIIILALFALLPLFIVSAISFQFLKSIIYNSQQLSSELVKQTAKSKFIY